MGRIRFNVSGRSTNRIPKNADERVNAGMRDAIVEATRDGKLLTQAITPKRSGATALTVDGVVLGGGAHVEGHFGSDDLIFKFLHDGTKPHEIRPSSKKALSWPGAAHPVKRVQHPGTKALNMLEQSGPIAGQVAKIRLADVYAEVFG